MERLGDDVARELGRFGPQAAIGRVAEAWPAAVGEQIARNAWPARIAKDGTLHVHTSSSAWSFELTQLEADIRERLGGLAPKRVRFAPGPLPEPEPSVVDTAASTPPTPSAEDVREGLSVAAEISDEKLRKLVARAAAASLANARSGPRI